MNPDDIKRPGIELFFERQLKRPLAKAVFRCCEDGKDELDVCAMQSEAVSISTNSPVVLDRHSAGRLADILKHFSETGKLEA